MGRDPAWWLQALALHGCIPRAGSQADRPPAPESAVCNLHPCVCRSRLPGSWALLFFFFFNGVGRAAAASHCSAASPAAPANFPALLPGSPGRAGRGAGGELDFIRLAATKITRPLGKRNICCNVKVSPLWNSKNSSTSFNFNFCLFF
ncbi:unnamed protein product [Lepidochelys kempii]